LVLAFYTSSLRILYHALGLFSNLVRFLDVMSIWEKR